MSERKQPRTAEDILKAVEKRARKFEEARRRRKAEEKRAAPEPVCASQEQAPQDAAPSATPADAAGTAAAENGGLAPILVPRDDTGTRYPLPYESRRLAAVAETAPSAACETEGLLNDLIAECRSLMRDVAFRSACLTPDPEDRLRFIASAENVALTGARIAETVGRLRHGSPSVEERRQRITVEHVQTLTAPDPGRGAE